MRFFYLNALTLALSECTELEKCGGRHDNGQTNEAYKTT